ncbi:MAG: hypothetical protein CVU14_05965 [Bacteroidetes bacterium HGW-Bacteroidetes-9]|jgi:hypothetical protein|nr:MAG: hypothetical protein CVU14_05965 [Bacteroidetes bacterium HGW-Bacteroidetes-9]
MWRNVVVAFLLLFPVLTFSQKTRIGMTMGLNFASWQGDDDKFATDLGQGMSSYNGFNDFSFTDKSRIGYNFGFFVMIPLDKSFFLQTEINYIQKGTKISGSGKFTDNSGWLSNTYSVKEWLTMQSDYIDINLLAKYYLSQNGVRAFILGGPGIALLARSKMKVKAEVDGESDVDTQDYDYYKSTDLNLNVAAGLEFNESLHVELRYQNGLTGIFKHEADNSYSIRNGGIIINLCVIF